MATVAAVPLSGVTIGTLLPFLPQAVKDLNVGIIALVLNVAVTLAVSAATREKTLAAPSVATPSAVNSTDKVGN